MLLGSLATIVGAVTQAAGSNLATFMTGRFIVGFGVAITSAAGPAYVSEMAHPAYRGAMTGIYNTFWYMGAIPGTFIPYATSMIDSPMAWRIPLWLQLINGGVVLSLCMFLPEVTSVFQPIPPLPTHSTKIGGQVLILPSSLLGG